MLEIVRAELGELGRRLKLNLLYLLGLMLAVTPFALWGPLPLRIMAFLIVWLGGTAYAVSKLPRDSISAWMVILAAGAVFMVAGTLNDATSVVLGEQVREISAARAPAYPNAVAFEFDDAVVQTDYAYTYRSASRDRKSGRISYTYYSVAPLTPAGWNRQDPVPAWVGCSDTYAITACPEWERAYTAGIVPSDFEQAGLAHAVEQALAGQGLTQAPGAPILEWVETIDAGAGTRGRRILLVALICYLVWAVPIILLHLGRMVDRLWSRARA